MTIKTITWKWIIPGCYRSSHPSPECEQETLKRPSFSRLSVSDVSDRSSAFFTEDLVNSVIGSKLHVFSFAELSEATQNFSRKNLLGEGGFGPVYKGFITDDLRPGRLKGQTVAVKSLDLDGFQGEKEWMAEIIFLGQLEHAHIVKLIGYCCEEDDRLLVYEFMAGGSLENLLFRKYSAHVPWSTRMKIALGAAKGLDFLHECEKPVIYRDFKTSNILLDSDHSAKLSDFGLAKDGPDGDDTHVMTRVMGTQGYAAPEYIMTGHLTMLSDVYGFGVVLLELLTGRRSMDEARPEKEQNLVEWARPMLKDTNKLDRIIDPTLRGQLSSKRAQKVAALAFITLSRRAKQRPRMSFVVKILESIQQCDDSLVQPFVYVVATENGKKNCAYDKSKQNQETKEEGEKNLKGKNGEEAKEMNVHNTVKKHHSHASRQWIKLPSFLSFHISCEDLEDNIMSN